MNSGPIQVLNFSCLEADFPDTFRTARRSERVRSAVLWWGMVLAFLGVSLVRPIRAADLPPGLPPIPAEILEREAVKRELRVNLPRKYRINTMEVENTGRGVGIDLNVNGDLTPDPQRGRSFQDVHERARTVARAFLAENPEVFHTAGPGVETVETDVDTLFGHTGITYAVQIAGVRLFESRAVFLLNESGELTSIQAQNPVISSATIANMKAAVARARITKEDALAAIEADRRRTKPDAKIWAPTVGMERNVFPEPPYVRWRVGLKFERQGGDGWGYEVDGETGAILLRSHPEYKAEDVTPPPAPLPPSVP